MKKLLIILASLLIIGTVCLYAFIPSTIIISKSVTIQANQNPLLRKVSNIHTWNEWWPGKSETNGTTMIYSLNKIEFKPGPVKVLSVPLSIDAGDFTTSTELTFVTLGIDSTTALLETTIPVSNN